MDLLGQGGGFKTIYKVIGPEIKKIFNSGPITLQIVLLPPPGSKKSIGTCKV